MRIGITGICGYVGLALVKRLRDRYDVVGVDNGYKSQLKKIDGVELFDVDIRDSDSLKKAFNGVDVIIHLASVTGVDACNENPDVAFGVNIKGTENVCRVAGKNGSGLIFAASMAVYGNPMIIPITELHPREPVNIYGKQKLLGMEVVRTLSHMEGFPAFVFVKSNIYGSYIFDGKLITKPTVINKFFMNVTKNEPLRVFSPGIQKRNFIHVEDVAEAYVKGIEMIENGFEIYNIANSSSVSIAEIAEKIADISRKFGFSPKVEYVENPRKDEVVSESFDVDVSKARNELGFEVKRKIEESIEGMFKITESVSS
ncbi:MAG: NAD(P)-dependent oxidoreductase [Candidatus Aenigmatarchaeota archaeon]|nr:MAG: NAD(P)-dependent oxidoreductase [Candidatus Aenigmarchaeota archaeon]